MAKKLPNGIDKAIAQLAHKGMSCRDISKSLFIGKSTVIARLNAMGIPRSHSWGGKGKGERKNGSKYLSHGYVIVILARDDFFIPTARQKTGHILEHRLVMAKHLGRNLHPWEVVHHINHDKSDNRIENLQMVSADKHLQITLLETRVKKLEERVIEQDALIKLLQLQNKNKKMEELVNGNGQT